MQVYLSFWVGVGCFVVMGGGGGGGGRGHCSFTSHATLYKVTAQGKEISDPQPERKSQLSGQKHMARFGSFRYTVRKQPPSSKQKQKKK